MPITLSTTVDVENLQNNESSDTWVKLDKVSNPRADQNLKRRKSSTDFDEKSEPLQIPRTRFFSSKKFKKNRLSFKKLKHKSIEFSRRKNSSKSRTSSISLQSEHVTDSDPKIENSKSLPNSSVKASFIKALKSQKKRHEKKFKSAVKYLKDNYMEPLDDENENENLDFDFAHLEIIVEEKEDNLKNQRLNDVEKKDNISVNGSQTQSDKTTLIKKGRKYFRKKFNKNKNEIEISDFFKENGKEKNKSKEEQQDEEEEVFEFSKADVVRNLKEDKLLNQNVLNRKLSPRDAELIMISGGIKEINLKSKRNNKFGAYLRRKVKIRKYTQYSVDDYEATKNIGPAIRPRHLTVYTFIPLFLLSLNHLIPFLAYYFNIFTSSEKFEEYFYPTDSNGEQRTFQFPPIVKIFLPKEYHNILNERFFIGKYLLTLGGMYVAYNLFNRFYRLFMLFRPKTVYVDKKKKKSKKNEDKRKKRQSFKFTMTIEE